MEANASGRVRRRAAEIHAPIKLFALLFILSFKNKVKYVDVRLASEFWVKKFLQAFLPQ
jgi:hypothetical protein